MIMSIDVKAARKKFDKKVDAVGKKAGMNYFERKKFVKTANNFCYDTGVNVASQLIVDGAETTAYYAGRLAFTAVSTGVRGVKAGAKGVANTCRKITGKNSGEVDQLEDDDQ
jgi:hypothetical protein